MVAVPRRKGPNIVGVWWWVGLLQPSPGNTQEGGPAAPYDSAGVQGHFPERAGLPRHFFSYDLVHAPISPLTIVPVWSCVLWFLADHQRLAADKAKQDATKKLLTHPRRHINSHFFTRV
jgi:hypothetical protein